MGIFNATTKQAGRHLLVSNIFVSVIACDTAVQWSTVRYCAVQHGSSGSDRSSNNDGSSGSGSSSNNDSSSVYLCGIEDDLSHDFLDFLAYV